MLYTHTTLYGVYYVLHVYGDISLFANMYIVGIYCARCNAQRRRLMHPLMLIYCAPCMIYAAKCTRLFYVAIAIGWLNVC